MIVTYVFIIWSAREKPEKSLNENLTNLDLPGSQLVIAKQRNIKGFYGHPVLESIRCNGK
jgi:hypothetical protein